MNAQLGESTAVATAQELNPIQETKAVMQRLRELATEIEDPVVLERISFMLNREEWNLEDRVQALDIQRALPKVEADFKQQYRARFLSNDDLVSVEPLESVRTLQRALGIEDDGVFGPDTASDLLYAAEKDLLSNDGVGIVLSEYSSIMGAALDSGVIYSYKHYQEAESNFAQAQKETRISELEQELQQVLDTQNHDAELGEFADCQISDMDGFLQRFVERLPDEQAGWEEAFSQECLGSMDGLSQEDRFAALEQFLEVARPVVGGLITVLNAQPEDIVIEPDAAVIEPQNNAYPNFDGPNIQQPDEIKPALNQADVGPLLGR